MLSLQMFRRAALSRPWLVALLAVAGLVGEAAAQQPGAPGADGSRDLRGSVVRDGQPLSGLEVTLHRVTPDSSGVFARTATDAAGQFGFSLPPTQDTLGFTVYFATVDYLSARYFGSPVHRDDVREGYEIAVYDTSSAAGLLDQVRLARRDLVMIPTADGGWEVNEVLRILNPTNRTLLPRDGIATWEFRVPEGVEAFQAGEGEPDADAVALMENRVLIRDPLIPGSRELFLRYVLPARRSPSSFALQDATDTLNVFVRQPSPAVTVTGASTTDVVAVEEERFLQFGALGVDEAARVEVEWDAGAAPPVEPVVAAVALTALLLAIGTAAAVRNRGRRAAPAGAPAAVPATADSP